MKITKIGHSCLLVEEGGKRLLIDPGNLSFAATRPQDLGDIDAILITHDHADHCYPGAIRAILEQGSPLVIATPSAGKALAQEGIPWSPDPKGLPVQAFPCPHGALPEGLQAPENRGYLIGGRLFHPGDSFILPKGLRPEVLALPVIAPWGCLREALACARPLGPKAIVPVHDGFLKDPDFLNRIILRAWPEAPLRAEIGKAFKA